MRQDYNIHINSSNHHNNLQSSISVSKVIIGQYLPYPLHQDQLPSEGEAPPHPISDSYWHNREHLYHPK